MNGWSLNQPKVAVTQNTSTPHHPCSVYLLNRAMPSLTNGEFDESITIQIHAYTDAGYSNELVSDSLALNFHYIDRTTLHGQSLTTQTSPTLAWESGEISSNQVI